MEERRFVVISIYMKLDDAAYKICRAYLHIYVLIYNCAADGTLQRRFFFAGTIDRRRGRKV